MTPMQPNSYAPKSVPTVGRLNYDALVVRAANSAVALEVGLINALPSLWKSAYIAMTPRETDLYLITHSSFEYMFDDYGSLEVSGKVPYDPTHEARLVAAFGHSKPQVTARDDYRLKGWVGPTEKHFGGGWDKGHFIAHSIGGAVDQCELNVFVQNRALNRGWSEEGKTYRLMENYCFANPGTFCFSRPIYAPSDGSAKPTAIEFGVLKTDGTLWVELFQNIESVRKAKPAKSKGGSRHQMSSDHLRRKS